MMRYKVIRKSDNLNLYHTPISPVEKEINLPSYLSGYTDGEGCFCVSIYKSKRHKFGWEVRPSFSVSQNKARPEVLHLFSNYFECGTLRPDFSDHTLKYEVRSLNDLIHKVIPHFEAYYLLSNKHKDFLIFKEVCLIMENGNHLTSGGLRRIFDLAWTMNHSGKSNRKYNLLEIKI